MTRMSPPCENENYHWRVAANSRETAATSTLPRKETTTATVVTPLPRKKKGAVHLPRPVASSSSTGHHRYSERTAKPHHYNVDNHAAIGVAARRRWRHFHGGERTTPPRVVGTTTDLQRKLD
ncbi:hypothetical protein DEO72_LG9g1156 [Vigna unguiculata]|uniref:Uncharacterized protein n=1 Tax=Vigna unguiculata TaxID=3917 RepID=A0A4D6N249_VIGUN|nr:hypothetical protein DEO72_LG9g1156 [Vigna unguiculata]